MYLKSIEIYGFKSFANKIKFKFQDGITAIVGPNGSGKSNVADAVRWVLGEQSAKQLRSSKMEDVIFSGTDVRKPMGYAYVMLTLDNEDGALAIDYSEVTVGRRVYRSGESEYLLNGGVCRLKDITDLFTDTGIGKEGYSIIGQGQIDKILSSKPEDRRELFDEAAGIGKYKKRKNVTLRNLDKERNNLVRIADILKEIETRLGPLEKQSKDAKKYLGIYEELKKLEVNLFIIEHDKIRSSKEEVDNKTSVSEESLKEIRKKHSDIINEYNSLEIILENYNTDIENDKLLLNNYKISIEKNEGDIKLIREQINSLKNQIDQNNDRIKSLDGDIDSKSKEKEQYIEENNKIDEEIEVIDAEQLNFISKLESIKESIEKFSKEIEEYNHDVIELLNKESNDKSNLQHFETLLEQNINRKTEIDDKILQYNLEEGKVNDELKNTQDKLQKLSKDINDSKSDIKELEAFLAITQIEIENLTAEINDKQKIYHSEKSRLNSLINMTERYEGYGNSIRKVMDLKENEPGIHGVVADLIKVEKEYETAIETALGGSMQNIVTDNENTAKKMIGYLKQNKYGRATFLPLTAIRGNNKSSENILQEKGVIGFADSLIETDETYKNLASYLLGKNLVVDNIDSAIVLSKKYRQSLRIVTLEGDLISPGGSMSGGAYRNTSNLLGRRREVSELEKSVKILVKELSSLNSNKEEKKNTRLYKRQELEKIKNELQNLSLKENTLELNIKQLLAKKQNIKEGFEEYKNTITQIDNNKHDLHDNINKIKVILTNNESKRLDYEQKKEQANSHLLEAKREEQELHTEQSAVKIRHSATLQKKDNLIENVKRLKTETEKLYIEKIDLEKSVKDFNDQINLKENDLKVLENNIENEKTKINVLEGNISKKTEEKDKETINYKKLFSERERITGEINELDKDLLRLNNQQERFSSQLAELTNHIFETYELTYTSALGLRDATIKNISGTKKQVKELKAKMKGLGSINIDAIEEYKEISERYEFLTKQKEDLQKSEENLIGIINELEEGMRKQFNEKFEDIKREFTKVFKELFGGGRASLSLTAGDDVLDAGVIITAEPPGKKLQNIMQLSGGEKALTAISLLFAIQNLKPSPFCLLDEIEAALDDSNVVRYANYLKKLSKNSQFITITHRRGTMNTADVLYGITMQEKGVSSLVAVSLIEDQLDQ